MTDAACGTDEGILWAVSLGAPRALLLGQRSDHPSGPFCVQSMAHPGAGGGDPKAASRPWECPELLQHRVRVGVG